MKTISEFKRTIAVGKKVHTIFHQEGDGRDENGNLRLKDKDLGIREVAIVQSNAFALKTKREDGSFVNSWCNYPKATEVTFNEDGSLTIYTEDFRIRGKDNTPKIKVLTYKFVD